MLSILFVLFTFWPLPRPAQTHPSMHGPQMVDTSASCELANQKLAREHSHLHYDCGKRANGR